MSCDPTTLLNQAKCFLGCVTPMQRRRLRAYLMCQIAATGAFSKAPVAPTSLTIDTILSSSNSFVLVWTQTNSPVPDNNLVDISLAGAAYIQIASVAGALTTYDDTPRAVVNNTQNCYKVAAQKGATTSSFSQVACVGKGLSDFVSAVVSYPDLIFNVFSMTFSGNVAMTTFSAPRLKRIDNDFSLNGCSALTSLTLTALNQAGGYIDLSGVNALVTVSFPALLTTFSDLVTPSAGATCAMTTFSAPLLTLVGNNFVMIGAPNCTSINLNSLQSTSAECDFINVGVATLSLPALQSVNGGGGLMIQSNANLTTVTLPVLTTVVQGFTPFSNPALTTLTLTNLATVGTKFDFSDNGSLVTLNLPALTSAAGDASYFGAGNGGLPANASGNFANLTIPVLVFTDGTRIDFNGCSLTATSVQNILRRSVISGLTTSTIDLSGGLNAGVASLNAQGQADYATLIAAPGNTVTLNP